MSEESMGVGVVDEVGVAVGAIVGAIVGATVGAIVGFVTPCEILVIDISSKLILNNG